MGLPVRLRECTSCLVSEGGSQQVTTITSYNGKLMSSNRDDALTSHSSLGRVNTIRPGWPPTLLERQSLGREFDYYGKINGNCVTNAFIIHEPLFSLWKPRILLVRDDMQLYLTAIGNSQLVHPHTDEKKEIYFQHGTKELKGFSYTSFFYCHV